MTHIGRNIARIRNFRGKKQTEIAAQLNMSQSEYSRLENRSQIDDDLLALVAEVLDCPTDVISSLDGDTTQNVFQQEGNNGNGFCYITNPLDKIVELYERLLDKERQLSDVLRRELETIRGSKGNE